MSGHEKIEIFLEDGLRASAIAGTHNFLRLLGEVIVDAGMTPDYLPITERHKATGRSLTHMKQPTGPDGLVFRRVYHYPFWQIDRTDKRWHWDTAHADFDPSEVPEREARRFRNFWRGRLFAGLEPSKDGPIFVPLQGKIAQHRSFQSCAPLDMVEAVLRAADRPVVVSLHPNEIYDPSEIQGLDRMIGQHPGAQRVTGEMDKHLPNCHCVITQNSSVAFNGFFFDKPAVLFAQIDFHHIAVKPTLAGLPKALANLPEAPDYALYLWWFWQARSINAGRPEAKTRIRARLSELGWPVT